MNKKHILKYIISFFLTLYFSFSWSQQETANDSIQLIKNDSLKTKKYAAIRIGIDVSRPIIQLLQKQDLGIEITADYKVAKNWYIASEFGYESEPGHEDQIDFHTKGSYAKLGFNYNAYENLEGLNNEVYIGLRYGFSQFQQQLTSYTVIDLDDYFGDYTATPGTVYEGLAAHWAELHFGLKVETLPHLYLAVGIHFKKLLSDEVPEGFANLYIPGFNKVLLNRDTIGFNYTISYQIPLKK